MAGRTNHVITGLALSVPLPDLGEDQTAKGGIHPQWHMIQSTVTSLQSFHKNPKRWGLKNLQVGDHVEIEEHGMLLESLFPRPCSLYLFYLATPELHPFSINR